jgi:protein-tyrosine phosphatase
VGASSLKVLSSQVDEWMQFMCGSGISHVVCLLAEAQLAYYAGLPGGLVATYRAAFGAERVLHQPIDDFHLAAADELALVLRFMEEAVATGGRVVVHCSGGYGRTGHVLAAWLVRRGYAPDDALAAVETAGRTPRDAVNAGAATEEGLLRLLAQCADSRHRA